MTEHGQAFVKVVSIDRLYQHFQNQMQGNTILSMPCLILFCSPADIINIAHLLLSNTWKIKLAFHPIIMNSLLNRPFIVCCVPCIIISRKHNHNKIQPQFTLSVRIRKGNNNKLIIKILSS